MKTTITCWKDHHYDLGKITDLTDLFILIHEGSLWTKEDSKHDEKVTITIETEEDNDDNQG